jgi:hypothetical protein
MKLEALFEEVPIIIQREHLLQQFLHQESKTQDLHINSQIFSLSHEEYTLNHL